TVKPDAGAALQVVRERFPPRETVVETHRAAFNALHHILTGGSRAARQPFVAPTDLDATIVDGWVDLQGPLRTASTLSENLLLEYLEGFSGPQLGWGRLDAANLELVLGLHTAYADLMRRTPALARARGSNLLTRVRQSIEQAASGMAVPG